MLAYYVFKLASWLAPWLPAAWGYKLAELAGAIGYYVLPKSREGIKANLRHVFEGTVPEDRLERAAKKTFLAAAKNYYDVFRIPRLNLEDLERTVRVDGWHHMIDAMKKGKGVIVFSAHLGNMELVAQIIVAQKMKGVIPVEHVEPEKLFKLVTGARSARGLRLIALDGGALREIYKSLRRNEIVGIGADRDIQGTGLPLRFFDAVTTMPDAPAILGLRSGAPVLPVNSRRLSDDSFLVKIHPPFEFVETGNIREDVRVNTERMVGMMEQFIRCNPEQWVVFQPVWKDKTVN